MSCSPKQVHCKRNEKCQSPFFKKLCKDKQRRQHSEEMVEACSLPMGELSNELSNEQSYQDMP